jgi:hypothetical protein
MAPTVTLRLTREQVRLLVEALDSHVYWQLSDPCYRDSGAVRGRGSDDPEARREIARALRLQRRLDEADLPAGPESHCACN